VGIEAQEAMNQAFVVVVGPDCSGKTGLIEALAAHTGATVVKGLRITERCEIMPHLRRQLAEYDPKVTGKGVIMDRWQFPDDIIYEYHYGRRTSVVMDNLRSFNKELRKVDVLFLYVTADVDVLAERLRIRGDDEVAVEQLADIHRRYEEFFNNTYVNMNMRLPKGEIDSTHLTKDEVFALAIQHIKRHYSGKAYKRGGL
jgi:deoxyadenosine/deoxycytidine kinase